MKTLYLECNMGAAGDMLMAALYELLDDQPAFLQKMQELGLHGVQVTAEPAKTCGIAGTHMRVTVHGEEEHEPDAHEHDHHHDHHHDDHEHEHEHEHEQEHHHHHHDDHDHEHHHDHHHGDHDHHHDHHHDDHDHEHHHHHDDHEHKHHHEHEHGHHHHHATPGHIAAVIDGLNLPDAVKQHARAVYDAIAQAEAKAHGCPVGDVHYHEVGALDAVADVTGVCYAMYLLGVDRVVVSPIHVGSGTVRCAHGVMPVPAPATANLLAGVPVYGGSVQGELCTPTGAALLTHFADAFEKMPVMRTQKVGIGIGTKQFEEQANCVRAFLGETEAQTNGTITELVCNLDDMTAEALALACEQLLAAGALDVYTVPGTMKKGRAGQVLTVLCEDKDTAHMAEQVLALTTTNGLRVRRCEKYFLQPSAREVSTAWGKVRVKVAEGFGITHVKPEFEDVAAIARKNGLSYDTVAQAVRRALKKEENA